MLKFLAHVVLTAVVLVALTLTTVVVASGVIIYAIYRHYHPRLSLPPAEQVHRLILVDGRENEL